MKNVQRLTAGVLAVGLSLGAAGAALAYTGQQYAAQAGVTIAQARATAMKTVPGGKITDQELEKENGGLRYSFDIKVGSKTREVGVDAKTGKVIENSVEGNNPD
ncbi:MAG: PepSY domain-containing protein [Candidatus Eremiobacteraeota bacterium]|nr:PepSY domain-containing protein [Candidatus Eremiobacteraeota bacterium]